MANVHPWFANTTIDDAAGWTYTFFQDTDIAQAEAAKQHTCISTNKPRSYRERVTGTSSTGAGTKIVDSLSAATDSSDIRPPRLAARRRRSTGSSDLGA